MSRTEYAIHADTAGYYTISVDGVAVGFACRNSSNPRVWEAWLHGQDRNYRVGGDHRTRREAATELWINRYDCKNFRQGGGR